MELAVRHPAGGMRSAIRRHMGEGPFQTSRQRYFDPREPGVYCVGSRTECRFLLADGAKYLDWGRKPPRPDQVGALFLMPSQAELDPPELPSYLSALSGATLLALPAPLLAKLRPEQVPPKLVTLQVDLDRRFIARGRPRWPDDLLLPQLLGLLFIGSEGSSGDWAELGVGPRHLPNLEFLASDVDEHGRVTDALSGFVELRHLELGSIASHDRLFERAPAGLRVLRLGGSGPKFSLAGLARLQKLVAVRLNTILDEIDCAVFRELPELVELDLLECRRVVNTEALLDCPKLQRISLVDCGQCFETPLRQRFYAHGFESIDLGEPDARPS